MCTVWEERVIYVCLYIPLLVSSFALWCEYTEDRACPIIIYIMLWSYLENLAVILTAYPPLSIFLFSFFLAFSNCINFNSEWTVCYALKNGWIRVLLLISTRIISSKEMTFLVVTVVVLIPPWKISKKLSEPFWEKRFLTCPNLVITSTTLNRTGSNQFVGSSQ